MRARAPATLRVVVEGGKVVVDEGERVHELHGGRCRESVLDLASRRFGDGEAEHGADSLSSALERVSKRLLEPAELGCERERAEIRLDGVAKLVSRPHPRSSARA